MEDIANPIARKPNTHTPLNLVEKANPNILDK